MTRTNLLLMVLAAALSAIWVVREFTFNVVVSATPEATTTEAATTNSSAEPTNKNTSIEHREVELVIPVVHQEMLESAGSLDSRIAERLDSFEDELVDSEWAASMEAGIRDYFAFLGPQNGLVMEYVQCRSASCIVVGRNRFLHNTSRRGRPKPLVRNCCGPMNNPLAGMSRTRPQPATTETFFMHHSGRWLVSLSLSANRMRV